MFRKIAIAGATAAVILGAGTAALAASGDSSSNTSGTPASSSSSSSTADHVGRFARRHPGIASLVEHHAVHGVIVTDGKKGYVTHDGVVGTVTAVSSTSISVKASDGFAQTFTVNSDTKVRVDKTKSSIANIKVGAKVGVVGTGTTSPVATFVISEAS